MEENIIDFCLISFELFLNRSLVMLDGKLYQS